MQIDIVGANKQYGGGICALHDVYLQIGSGELVVLVGPSGSGKTTLLRLIAGLEPLSGGRILLNDREVQRIAPARRHIGYLPQDEGLYPHWTVKQNLRRSLRWRKLPQGEIDRRIAWASETFHIGELLKKRPHELSGGERRRAALARILTQPVACLLLDEPLQNIDIQLRAELLGEIQRLRPALECTTVWVTHDRDEAMQLGDRVGVFCEGHLEQVGTVGELHRRPASPFVLDFLCPFRTNRVTGNLSQEGDTLVFRDHENEITLLRRLAPGERPAVPLPAAALAVLRADGLAPVAQTEQSTPVPWATPVGRVQAISVAQQGASHILEVRRGSTVLTVVLPAVSLAWNSLPKVGDVFQLAVATSELHFFTRNQFGRYQNILPASSPHRAATAPA